RVGIHADQVNFMPIPPRSDHSFSSPAFPPSPRNNVNSARDYFTYLAPFIVGIFRLTKRDLSAFRQ
ncbi:hypothetical protein, partial [Pantoea dispersa]|uniref:hypothetical protein n=1 Tax=Pantoea dispersa TaxID=59814 RepID=UPI001C03B45A